MERKLRCVCSIVLCSILTVILSSGCSPVQDAGQVQEQEKECVIDWKLYGTWVSEGGETGEHMELSISTKAEKTEEPTAQAAELSIQWADSFRYTVTDNLKCGVHYYAQEREENGYFFFSGSAYDTVNGTPVPMLIAIFPEKECAVYFWETEPEDYFVASTDPDADMMEILKQYKMYVDAVNG